MAESKDNQRSERLRSILAARRGMVGAAAWLVVLALVLSAATFAWFSGSRFTNVTPVAHTVSEDGYDLLISANEGGPFDTTCQLSAADKTLYPISTADLSTFWRATFQNASGITTDYANCTSQLNDYALTGTFYLKGAASPLAVYLYLSQMSVSADPQLLAAARVGFIVQSASGTHTFIFSCDGSGNSPVLRSGAQPLFTLGANEVASVRYFVYMEGCDANCITEAQSKNFTLQFAFAGAKA